MLNILVLIEVDESLKQKMIDECKGVNLVFCNRKEVTLEKLNEFDVLIGNLTMKLLKEPNNLKWIHFETAGVEQFLDIDENIILTNSTGAYGEAIAEYMIAAVFTLYKRFHEYIDNKIYRSWEYLGKVKRVYGSNVLVVGLGDIGYSFARKMKALGCNVSGVKRTISEKPDYIDNIYTFDNIDEVIGDFDIVALSLPHTKDTNKIFDYNRIKKMKKDAVFINVGRGKTVDTDGLIKALEEDHLLGVCLDVVDPEPLLVNSKLWQFDNVIITPHVSGNYSMDYTLERVVEIAIDNINRYSKGEELINIVDRKLGYKK